MAGAYCQFVDKNARRQGLPERPEAHEAVGLSE